MAVPMKLAKTMRERLALAVASGAAGAMVGEVEEDMRVSGEVRVVVVMKRRALLCCRLAVRRRARSQSIARGHAKRHPKVPSCARQGEGRRAKTKACVRTCGAHPLPHRLGYPSSA